MLGALPRPGHVEEPPDDERQGVLMGVGEGERLAGRLARRVTEPELIRRSETRGVVFAQGRASSLSVDLRSGGEEHRTPGRGGVAKHDLRSQEALSKRSGRTREDQPDPHSRRQVRHGVAAADEVAHQPVVADLTDDHLDPRIAREIVQAPGGEVVEHDHTRAFAQGAFDEGGTDQAAATGDEQALKHGLEF